MSGGKARLPPRWFIVTFWHVHRRIVRASRGRRGLWPPRSGKYGALRLTTTGRSSGEQRLPATSVERDGSMPIQPLYPEGFGRAAQTGSMPIQRLYPEGFGEPKDGTGRR
jgi:F420H(2)-dependent quinone reductase